MRSKQINPNRDNLREKNYPLFLAANIVPDEKKLVIFALLSFHQEIAAIPAEVSEPMIGLIKIQWWRDVLNEITEGKPPRPHPVLKEFIRHEIDYAKLHVVLNTYQKLLENWQPHSFIELTEFIENTDGIIFAEAAKLLGREYNRNNALAYSYSQIARKLALNSKLYSRFATKPETMIEQLISQAKLLAKGNSALSVIARHYAANPYKPRPNRLIFSLILKAKTLI